MEVSTPFSKAKLTDDRDGCHFGQGLLAEMVTPPAEPPLFLGALVQTQPDTQDLFLLRSPSNGAAPGSSPWGGGEEPASQGGKCLL